MNTSSLISCLNFILKYLNPMSEKAPNGKGYFMIADKAIEFMVDNIERELSLDEIACYCEITKFTLCRTFKTAYGTTVMTWLWDFRANLAKELIEAAPRLNLTSIAFMCGFTSSAHFSRTYKATFGLNPSEHRRKVIVFPNRPKMLPSRPLLRKAYERLGVSNFT